MIPINIMLDLWGDIVLGWGMSKERGFIFCILVAQRVGLFSQHHRKEVVSQVKLWSQSYF